MPSYATAKREEAKALDVLAQVLGGGSNSRLYRRLVVDKRLATNAGAAYQGSAVDPTRLSVYATPQPGVALPDIENEIDAVIAEVIADGVAAEELERAKTRLIADATYAQDNQSSMARWFGVALSTGSTVQDVLTWPDRIRAVSAAQVQSAAKTWLDKRRSATGYLVKCPAVDLEWRVRGLEPLHGGLGDRAVLTVDQEIRRAELALACFAIVGACKLRGLLLELRPISVICIATYVAILEAHGGCEPAGASHGTG